MNRRSGRRGEHEKCEEDAVTTRGKVVGSSPSPATIAVVQKNGCFFVMSEIPQKAVVGPEEGYEPLGE